MCSGMHLHARVSVRVFVYVVLHTFVCVRNCGATTALPVTYVDIFHGPYSLCVCVCVFMCVCVCVHVRVIHL